MNDPPTDLSIPGIATILQVGARRSRGTRIVLEHGLDHAVLSEQVGDEPIPLWMMKITQAALREMINYLCDRDPEAAGILLGPVNDDVLITHFVPDATGKSTPASFALDGPELSRLLKRVKPAGIHCKGIAHTHPRGVTEPSTGDLRYLRGLFAKPGADPSPFFMPIVCNGRLYPYVFAHDHVWQCTLVVV